MWSRSSICSICCRHYMYLTKYSHFLGALLDTGLRNALIQNDGSLLFWQSPVALTRHRTYNFLTLHCQKFYSPFPKQSSLSLRVGLCCCWSYIYRHPVATFEDYGWLVHSHLKKKQLNDHYFILIHVNDKFLTKAWHIWLKKKTEMNTWVEDWLFGSRGNKSSQSLRYFSRICCKMIVWQQRYT